MRSARVTLRLLRWLIAIGVVILANAQVIAAGDDAYSSDDSASDVRPLQRVADSLPSWLSDDLYLEGWTWWSYLHDDLEGGNNYYDGVVSLEATKSFDQRIAITAQGDFVDADGTLRGALEQGYGSIMAIDQTQTIVTLGKFNADFGVEGRDFWDRTTGTTSLLFSAQPQDLVGLMITQPIGDTGITLKPFVSADFQGEFNFHQPLSTGLSAEYQPTSDVKLGVTDWVGPGLVLGPGMALNHPFPESYGEYGDSVMENWQGPYLYGNRGGTMNLVEAKAQWQIRPDLALSGEYLYDQTPSDIGTFSWNGFLVLADYDITDRLHLFARWSYLDDHDWFTTGYFEKDQELSGGISYELVKNVELRAEYRHDFSNVTPEFNTVSVHLTASF